MEINTQQQLDALFHVQEQQAQLARNNNTQPQGFETLLNQQLLQNNVSPQAPLAQGEGPARILSEMFVNGADAGMNMDADTAVLQAAFEEASGTLELWDSYAQTLGRSSSDTALRDAYEILQGIDSRISQLRTNPMSGKNAQFDDILNELEILSVTEKFKFNRGDYLG